MTHFPTAHERAAIAEITRAIKNCRALHRDRIIKACQTGAKGFRVDAGMGGMEREPEATVIAELRAEGYKVEPGSSDHRGEYGTVTDYFYTVSWD